ncbi:bidirectional sugar transporter SWEET16-like [Lolium rigidum]|uniref:bidirectional sugar transporter SWEET16-like n=1 Tax=Lolium rigidum TaxID=89674 RepID=UPI001F5D1CAA|nr:bidirectional sugar transporter SWEET16-like [Lolium rigidum]
MADPSFFVGIIGNIISILVFTSPIGTFRRVVKNKSTEEFRWLPYVTTLLSTSLWTFYGLLKPGGLLIVTVNGAGAALQAVYVALYLAYAPRDTRMKMVKVVLAVNVSFFAAVVLVGLLALHGPVRLFAVGLLCSALTIGMYAAPMAAMMTVVKTKSVEYMPFFLSFFLFLNGGIWSVYSLLVKDFFIGIPNAMGFAMGTAQLALYMAYRNKKKAVALKVDDGPEGDEEKGVVHLMGQVELGQRKVPSLKKGTSLPKTLPSPLNGIGHIIKALSATPLELRNVMSQHERVRDEDANDDDEGRHTYPSK